MEIIPEVIEGSQVFKIATLCLDQGAVDGDSGIIWFNNIQVVVPIRSEPEKSPVLYFCKLGNSPITFNKRPFFFLRWIRAIQNTIRNGLINTTFSGNMSVNTPYRISMISVRVPFCISQNEIVLYMDRGVVTKVDPENPERIFEVGFLLETVIVSVPILVPEGSLFNPIHTT